MAEESGKFLQKFEASTTEMREELAIQNQDLVRTIMESTAETEDRIQDMLSDIENNFDMVAKELKLTEEEINHNLEQVISDNEDNTEYQDRIQTETKSGVLMANANIAKVAWKLNALLDKFDIEDPEITYKRNEIKSFLTIFKSTDQSRGIIVTDEKLEEYRLVLLRNSPLFTKIFTLEVFQQLYDEVEVDESYSDLIKEIDTKQHK